MLWRTGAAPRGSGKSSSSSSSASVCAALLRWCSANLPRRQTGAQAPPAAPVLVLVAERRAERVGAAGRRAALQQRAVQHVHVVGPRVRARGGRPMPAQRLRVADAGRGNDGGGGRPVGQGVQRLRHRPARRRARRALQGQPDLERIPCAARQQAP
jgi:hypothetical protein